MADRRTVPYSPSQAFLSDQEARAEAWREVEANGVPAVYDRQGKAKPLWIDPTDWQGVEVPKPDWLVEGFLERHSVALFSGDGGMGKSLLMMQLCTAMALGEPWLDMPVQQMRTQAVFCEDTAAKLHRRLDRVTRFYGCEYADVGGYFHMMPRGGHESYLENFDRKTDKGHTTPWFGELREAVLHHKAKLLILDAAADVFGGFEISRQQVRSFIMTLTGLALEMDGSIILTSHPSQTGKQSGEGTSGSTHWHNGVRSRAYLTLPRLVSEDDETTTQRQLKFLKNNEGPRLATIMLDWKDGVFQAMGETGNGQPIMEGYHQIEVRQRLTDILRALVNDGVLVPHSPEFHNGLVNRARKTKEMQKWSIGDLASVQSNAIAVGNIVKVEMGPPSKRRVYLRCPEQRLPGEPADDLLRPE